MRIAILQDRRVERSLRIAILEDRRGDRRVERSLGIAILEDRRLLTILAILAILTCFRRLSLAGVGKVHPWGGIARECVVDA